jgi:hypothetical protein
MHRAKREEAVKKARTLSLLATMALALTALTGAASASASGFVSEEYPDYLTAYESSPFYLTAGGITQNCTGPSLGATMGNATEALTLPAIADGKCSLGPMKMNGCKFIFYPTTATMGIGPGGCGPITVNGGGCEISIGAQSGIPTTYLNEGSGENQVVRISFNTNSLVYTQNNGIYCGGKGTFYGGKFGGAWLLKGFQNPSHTVPTGIHVGAANGLYLGGGGSLEAEAFPASVIGEQTKTITLNTTGVGKVKCTSALFNGEIPSSSSELSLSAEYQSCVALGLLSTINMNSCHYVLHFPGSGTADIACGKAGDAIEVSVGEAKVCTVKVPAQTIAGASYENTGTGSGRQVIANLAGEGNAYTIAYPKGETEGKCGKSGSFSNGTTSGAITMHALN